MWATITNKENLPSGYAKVNFGISIFDCVSFWILWGYGFTYIFNWVLFGLEAVRAAIAYLLYIGTKERNLMKCKIFCITEFIMVCCRLLILIGTSAGIKYYVYVALTLALRLFGIRIIGEFVRKLQIERGESTSFLWKYFPEPKRPVDSISYEPSAPSAPSDKF